MIFISELEIAMKQVCPQMLVAVVLAGIGILIEVRNGATAQDIPAEDLASINKTCKQGNDCPGGLDCLNITFMNSSTCQSLCLIYPEEYILTASKSRCVLKAGRYGCKTADQCTENAICVTGIPRPNNPKSEPDARRRKKRAIVITGRRYYRPYRPVYYYRPRPAFYRPYSYYHRPYHYGYHQNYYPVPVYSSGSGSESEPKENPIGDCHCRFGPKKLGFPNGACPSTADRRSLSITSIIFCGILQLIITTSYLI